MMKSKLFIILNTILTIGGCDRTDNRFVIINNTPITISYYIARDSTELSAVEFYSKKFYTNPENRKIDKEFDYVKSEEKKPIPMIGSWENYFDNQFKDGVAYIYVIDSFDIGKDAETLKSDKSIRKYKTSSKDMKGSNWEFVIK